MMCRGLNLMCGGSNLLIGGSNQPNARLVRLLGAIEKGPASTQGTRPEPLHKKTPPDLPPAFSLPTAAPSFPDEHPPTPPQSMGISPARMHRYPPVPAQIRCVRGEVSRRGRLEPVSSFDIPPRITLHTTQSQPSPRQTPPEPHRTTSPTVQSQPVYQAEPTPLPPVSAHISRGPAVIPVRSRDRRRGISTF